MKRTDQERIERELKRREKHATAHVKPDTPVVRDVSVSGYIRGLYELLHYDQHQIYNTLDDENVLGLLLDMKTDLPEKQWDTVLRSAIQKTKVEMKDLAFNELKSMLAD